MSVQKLQSTDSGLDDFDDAELEQLYTWIDSIPLSRPKKNIGRDFSDGGRLHKLCLVILTFKNDDSFLLIFLGHCLQIKKKSKNKKIECQLNQLISCMYICDIFQRFWLFSYSISIHILVPWAFC